MTVNRIVASVWIGVLLAAAWLGGRVYQARQAQPARAPQPCPWYEREAAFAVERDHEEWWRDLRHMDWEHCQPLWERRDHYRALRHGVPYMPYAED